MKVLMISTDRKILDSGSVVSERMREYADVFGELHIVVFCLASNTKDNILKLSPSCFVYPTRSRSKISYIFDAIRIGSKILSGFAFPASDSVVTTQDPFETGIVGLLLAKRHALRLNVQIHTDFHSPYFVQGSLLNRIRRIIAGCVLPRATSVRAVSERIKSSLPKLSNVSVVPIYSEVASVSITATDRFPQFDKVVLMISRLEKEKDIVSALKAFAVVEKSFKNIGLVIAGSGSMEALLTRLSHELGVGEKVMFLGWRDEAELSTIRASSDVFLSTSLYEGYGLSLIESARAGLPIVSTDAGIALDLLSNDVLAVPRDVDAIARLLIEALQHPQRFTVSRDAIAQVAYPSKAEYLLSLKKSLLV